MEKQTKKHYQMAYFSYDKFWRSEFYKNDSAKVRLQDIEFNQLNFKVNDAHKKDEKITRKIEPSKDEDVINKSYHDTKLTKIESQISYIENDLNYTTTNNLLERFKLKEL